MQVRNGHSFRIKILHVVVYMNIFGSFCYETCNLKNTWYCFMCVVCCVLIQMHPTLLQTWYIYVCHCSVWPYVLIALV